MNSLNIKKVRVNWNHGYANSPSWCVDVEDSWGFPNPYDNWPHYLLKEWTADNRLPGESIGRLYLATFDIWAHFVFDRTRPGKTSTAQFDGQSTGNLLLEDGTHRRVYDGWTSRSGIVNKYLPDEDHIADVTLYSGSKYNLGRFGLAIKVSALQAYLPEDVHIVRRDTHGGEHVYYPSASADKLVKA